LIADEIVDVFEDENWVTAISSPEQSPVKENATFAWEVGINPPIVTSPVVPTTKTSGKILVKEVGVLP